MSGGALLQIPARLSCAFGRWISLSFENAGRTYNNGNALALLAALTAALASSGGKPLLANVALTFLGGPPAILMTAGSTAFFLGGARYDRAYRNGPAPDARNLCEGHVLSGLGAILVALGLASVATSGFGACAALLGGALHAAGKIGSAFSNGDAAWKLTPLVSRIFSLASLTADLRGTHGASLATVTILIACVAIWARADAMLLSNRQALALAALFGLQREAQLSR